MKKWIRFLFFGMLLFIGAIGIYFVTNPSKMIFWVLSAIGEPTKLLTVDQLGSGVKWHGDYFTVEYIDSDTIAIGEPRYNQKNISYLIIGKKRALLFDSGPGIKDISATVKRLTNMPITVAISHFHYDHVGNLGLFDSVALLDFPHIKNQVDSEGYFHFEKTQHLGAMEKINPPQFKVSNWLSPEEAIDLGGRTLKVISTPGHTPESLMLYDANRKQLFTGDYLYAGELLAILPGADMGAYLQTSQSLQTFVDKASVLLPGHGESSLPWQTPRLGYQDIIDLHSTLLEIREGTRPSHGTFPRQFTVNNRIILLTPFSWNMNWHGKN